MTRSTHKTCTKCKETKANSEFSYRDDHKTLRSHCKKCINAACQRYRRENPEVRETWEQRTEYDHAAYMRNYVRKNPVRIWGHRLRFYWPDLTWQQRVAEYQRLFDEQKGCCKICLRHQSELNKKLAVDHRENPWKVRGLLCGDCNTGIGLFKHDLWNLESAIAYLQSA